MKCQHNMPSFGWAGSLAHHIRPSMGALLLCLAWLAFPALANERCSDLGIQTVNWKSPDSAQTGVLILHVAPGCVAAELGMRAGEVISKTELTERIYAQDFDRDSNTIEVFIGRLRRKLDPDNTLKPIETLRGRGYRLQLERSADS